MQLDLLHVTAPVEVATPWRVGSVWGKREFESLAAIAGRKLIESSIPPDERYPWNGGAAERWYAELCRENGGLRPPRKPATATGSAVAEGAIAGSIYDPNLVSERLCFRLAQQEQPLAAASDVTSAGIAPKTEPRAQPDEALTGQPPTNLLLARDASCLVRFGGAEIPVKNSLGMRYIAELLRAQGRSVPAVELRAVVAGTPLPAPGSAGEALDARARADYRQRRAALRVEIEEAERCNDLLRAERAHGEFDAITAELGRSTGLGGRSRFEGADRDRARKAVGNAIGRAVKAIERAHSSLGQHLHESISTGHEVMYRPVPHVDWSFD